MKRSGLTTCWLAAIVLGGLFPAAAQTPLGTEFTYQGQLKDAGAPADGFYDFVFNLYDSATGGAQVAATSVDAVLITDGLFTVELDFGSGVFTGDALWLETAVRDSDIGGEYTALSPRQPLNAAPYALYALDGPGGGGYWAENGTSIYNMNSGNVGIGTSSPSFTLDVQETDPSIAAAISGYHTNGFGVKGGSTEGYGVFGASSGAGGIGVYGFALGANSSGVFGVSLGEDGYAGSFNGRGYFSGNLGIGTNEPQEMLHVAGNIRLEHSTSDPGSYFLFRDTGTTQGTIDKYTSNGNVILDINPMAADGVGTAALRLFRSTNTTGLKQVIFYRGNNTTSASAVIGMDGADSFFQIHGGNVGIGTATPTVKLDVAGEAKVEVLHITGADVAERFPVSETPDAISPGTVMEIDPQNPGQLRVARGAYNRRVAGVVSGAGGLSAGTILGSLPDSDDAPPIALSGRVWVRCDSSENAIEVGDLLTTAKAPGHAMAVRDFSRAHGAVIGKAMTPLAQGETGLVLVLVNLQ